MTEIGLCLWSRRSRFGGRPLPDHFFGGSGAVSDVHTVVLGKIPSTYEKKGYKPDFDKLPFEDEYKAAQEKLRNAKNP